MADLSKFLHYGDCVYIQSSEFPKAYLSARSILEEKIFFLKSPMCSSSDTLGEIDSTFYENQSELEFIVYPKLSYQAYKNYMKVKPNDDPFKVQLLKKRLDVELEQNQKLIDKMMSTHVTFGSEIQLLHQSSKSFIRATREKNPVKVELYELRLSRKGGSGMYFKIIPYLTFKKEGEKVSLKDFFYLENIKLQASIVYKGIPEFPLRTNSINFEKEGLSWSFQQIAHRNNMPLLELSSAFEKYEAGLRQQDMNSAGLRKQDLNCPLGVNLVLPHKHNYTSKNLLWGSYIRLKFMLNTKQTGYFYCDHTIIGASPNVFCRILNSPPAHEKESFQAIFQLVPIYEDLYGTPVTFSQNKDIFLRLRHLLTGRYLEIGAEKGKCSLSETLSSFLIHSGFQPAGSATSKNNTEPAIIRHRNLQMKKERSNFLLTVSTPVRRGEAGVPNFANVNNAIRTPQPKAEENAAAEQPKAASDNQMIYIKLNSAVPQQENGQEKEKITNSNESNGREKGYNTSVLDYFEKTSIRLKNASQDDERVLTSDSVFSLESLIPDEEGVPGCLTVKKNDKNDVRNQPEFKWMFKSAYDDKNTEMYFKARFHEKNLLGKEELEAMVSSQNDIYFHFTPVNRDEISEIMAVQSKLYSIIKLTKDIERKLGEESPKTKSTPHRGNDKLSHSPSMIEQGPEEQVNKINERKDKKIAEAFDSVRKLSIWLLTEDPACHVGTLSKQVKQKMMRELGVIDVLIDLLIQLFGKDLLRADSKMLVSYKPLTQGIFDLLQTIISKNKANNVYVFQWSNLLQEMTLSNTIASDLGVDKLLSQIFYENIIGVTELSEIPKHLDFESYDLKALNIGTALYRYNPIRSSEEKDTIIKTLILNDGYRSSIFRKLEQDDQGNVYALGSDDSRILKIDNSLEYKDKKKFDFCMGIIYLATEITRSKPQIVNEHLKQVIPIKLCTQIFENKRWNFLFRSIFLDLFTEMYFSVQSAQLVSLSFPSNIKFLHEVSSSNKMNEIYDPRKEAVLSYFINEEFDIKKFIWTFLMDLHKWTDDEHKFVLSVFKLIYLMCIKGIYDWGELSRLKQSIYLYLKAALSMIHSEIAPEVKFENKTSGIKLIKQFSMKLKNKLTKRYSLDPIKMKKGSSKDGNTSQDEEDEQDQKEEKNDLYWESVQNDMAIWIQEALKILEFIERYELDTLQKDFFDNEGSRKFFNEKLVSRIEHPENMLEPEIIAKIKKDKEAYVFKYTNDNFVLQNYKNTILLLEFLLINNSILATQIVHLLYLNFSRIKGFLTSLNSIYLIHPGNIGIYNLYIGFYDRLRLLRIQLDSLYGSKSITTGNEIFQEVDKVLSELLSDLYKIDDIPRDENSDVSNAIYDIYEDYQIDELNGKEKQIMLRNLNFFDLVVDLFMQLLSGNHIRTKEMREKYLNNFLLFSAYFCVNNSENQKIMTENQSFIENLLKIDFPDLQPLLLRVISEMYKENFSLLIHVSQTNNNIISLLLKKFFENFTTDGVARNDFFIQCLRIFPTFFQVNNIFITQNQVYFAKSFYSKVLEKPDKYAINRILSQELPQYLKENRIEDHVLPDDPYTVKVPLRISFAIYFLNTFSMMVAGASASDSVACLNNKYYISINDISTLLKEAGDWFNLKLALVTFLNHVYIRNKKLEDNETTDLYNIVKKCMFEELNEYNRFIRNRHLYPRSSRQKFSLSFSEHYSVSTEFRYKYTVDELYHQYILYGVMDTFLFYSQRLKSQPSENDHAILDDYVSSSLPELQEFWNPNPNQKRNFQLDVDMSPIKNKMLVPLDEPTDPDIVDGDLLVPQQNQRKKATQLKKEILKTTQIIKRKDKVKEFKVFPTKNTTTKAAKPLREQLNLDFRTIEARHNMELEILVKFLLQMRLENPLKFKIAIQRFMNVLVDEDVPMHIKQGALSVIRKLSNFKKDPEIYESIQMDLVQLKFIDFFDDVIVNAKSEDDRLEFILAMIDFLDDASQKVQQELYETLYSDEDNLLLETIKKFILSNFEDFRENERNLTDPNSENEHNFTAVVYKKMYRVIYALELLRLSCENHFELMQNFLREQTQANGKNKKSINFINIISDIFSRFTKKVNEKNAILGLKILDTLTELLQGPCLENQLALCNARILENLQDLIVETSEIRKKKDSTIWTEMNNKIVTLILSILEGSTKNNVYIINQVSIHINASFFLERMEEIYNKVVKQKKKVTFKKVKKQNKNPTTSQNQRLAMGLAELESELLNSHHNTQTEEDHKVYINEGIQLGIILDFLIHLSPNDIKVKLNKFRTETKEENLERWIELQKAENYYNRYIGQIEIVNKKGDLQRIFFPIVDKTKYLSSVSKEKFLDEVKRESSNEKLFGLVRNQGLFEEEMEHFLGLKNKGLKLNLTYFSRLRDINLLVAVATNILVLFEQQITESLKAGSPDEDVSGSKIIQSLGVVHIVLCALVILFWAIFKAPLEIATSFKKFESRKNGANLDLNRNNRRDLFGIKKLYQEVEKIFSRVRSLFFDTYLTYLIANLLFALLGTLFSKVFFSFLLLDLIDRSIILNNVVKSVTVNYKQLLMTVVLGILIIYVYAVLGYFAVLQGEIAANICDSVFHCFLYAANNGLRAGGGIGEAIDTDFGITLYQNTEEFKKRYFYDLFYFLIIIIVLLNIVFGIIIDTFAELRDQKTLKDYDEKNICFICNMDRTVFEKAAKSFEAHVRVEHNVWNYLYYMVYLNSKNKLDYNGTESYVYEKIQKEDLSWFPIQRAYCLSSNSQDEEGGEDVKAIIDEKLNLTKAKIIETIASTSTNQQFLKLSTSQLKGTKGKLKARKHDHKPTYIPNN